MAYEVLARKWRPKHFDDVLGQEHVTRTLRNAIESKRVAHAYLFVGPRGIGKTTLSRIFAKALNCSATGDATAEPCDKCANCTEIMAGTSLDVIEIDAASNNGVDNIRDIRDEAQFAPVNSRYKIYIVDEVHMLSAGAFNALLKTLEEPPPHVKFILATTEFDKLPATIVSRCQRFDLRRIPTSLILKNLSGICEKEGVTASEDALLAIARGAEGGMRDALSALDQIISFKGQNVTEADVLAVFGLVSRRQIEALTTAILKGDMAGGLKLIDELDQSGKDLRRLVVELLGHFRNLMVRQQLGNDAGGILDVTPEQLKTLDMQAGLADTGRVLRVAEHFADLEGRIRYALSRRTIFETVFLRCCRASTVVTLDQVIRQLSQGAAATVPVPAAPAPQPAARPAAAPTQPQAQTVAPPSAPPPRPVPQPAPAAGSDLRSALLGPRNNAVRPAPAPAPAPGAASKTTQRELPDDGDDNPIRAAHEPAIKAMLKVFKGHITDIRPPLPEQAQATSEDNGETPDGSPEQDLEPVDAI